MYMTKNEICKELGMGRSTVTARVREMERSHRYRRTDIIRDGNLLWVDWFAFIDWMITRREIQHHPVPPYDRRRAEREIPAPKTKED